MDLEDRDLAALEERLYSSIHHSYEAPLNAPGPEPAAATATRVVSRTSVVNNGTGTLPTNMKRYWVGSAAVSSYADRGAGPLPKNKPQTGVAPKPPAPAESVLAKNSEETGTSDMPRMFLTPYQSLLGNMGDSPSQEKPASPNESANQSTGPERAPAVKEGPQKDPTLLLKKKKQTKQPMPSVEKKLASLTKLINQERKETAIQTMAEKKAKAKKVRNRNRQQQQHVVAEIILNSSDEESNTATPAKMQKSAPVSLSDEETDEVIIIPTPPPPQICIDCSDDEEPPSAQFAFPKSSRKSKKKKPASLASPRCLSPSNSSIMSDDFIGQHDRSRLNDSFTESIPNDDELECSMEGAARPGKAKKNTSETRQERVPSISSEDTVCTSGDTTDQEKRSLDVSTGILSKAPLLPQQCNGVSNAPSKSKKDNATTKKTPSKVKTTKAVAAAASPTVEGVVSPSVSKSKATAVGTIASDTATTSVSKTTGKSKTRTKSPLTLVLEVARKHFAAQEKNSRDGSGKKVKHKKDNTIPMESLNASTEVSGAVSENETMVGKSGTTPKAKKKKNVPTKQPLDEVVSSESDYDLSLTTTKASTPKGPEKKTRRSASTFFEEIAEVSSESDYDESFLQQSKKNTETQKQAKETKKRLGRKRKQYNSETYSDEDFACLLTDIVRAVSDTEDEENEDDDNDETLLTTAGNQSGTKAVTANTEMHTPSKPIRNLKKKKKLNDSSAAAAGDVLPAGKPDSEQLGMAVAGKKKKKQKEPKGSSAKTPLLDSSTPKVQIDQSEDQLRSQVQKSKETRTENSNNVQIIADTDSDDTDEIRIIENSYNGRTSAASGTSSGKAQSVGPDCAWNEEMKQFYNHSWAEEDFNLKSVLRQMPRDSKQWPIVYKDRYPDPPKKEIFCSNCGERGHMRFKCRNKPKPATCFMCGEQGHKEPRCPKTICLNCGAKTRNFVRGCKSCAKDADITCFSCGVRGHTQRSCPDLWRRYHSTIEDNVPLKEDFERNPKARWCCICCRHGHQAHTCNDARRIFGHPIPNISVSSYMPAYRGEYNRCTKHQVEEQQRRLAMDPTARYNLFSCDANECEVNLPEVAQNENGFYYNFLRSTGLLERHERPQSQNETQEEPEIKDEQDQTMLAAEESRGTPTIKSSSPEPTVSQTEESNMSPPVKEGMSSHLTPELCNKKQTIQPATALPIVEENSNYSFSEFHVEEQEEEGVGVQNGQSAKDLPHEKSNQDGQSLSDYIPLAFPSDVPECLALPPLPPRPPRPQRPLLPPAQQSPVPEEQQPSAQPTSEEVIPEIEPSSSKSTGEEAEEEINADARVMLSKEHAKLLLSEQGSTFLNEAGKQHQVRLSITFEAIGNVLLITGTSKAQDQFHEQLVRYLTNTGADTKSYCQNCPKFSEKMVSYIVQHLKMLKKLNGKLTIRSLLAKFNEASTSSSREKQRRILNTQLFGVYGLRDGRKHLNVLRDQLAWCAQAEGGSELTEAQRTTVQEAIRYIFSGYDHQSYALLVEELEELQKTNKLEKQLTFNDLTIPRWLITGITRKSRMIASSETPQYKKFKEKLRNLQANNGPMNNKVRAVNLPSFGVQQMKNGPVVKASRSSARVEQKMLRKQKKADKRQRQAERALYRKFRKHQDEEDMQYQCYLEDDDDYYDDTQDDGFDNDFIMNTSDQQIDPNRLDLLHNSTRHIQEQDWIEAESNYQMQQQQMQQHYRNAWSNQNQYRWTAYGGGGGGGGGSAPRKSRFHWVRQPEAADSYDRPAVAASPSNVSGLDERVNTLRDQELSQLQRLQNLLR